MSRQSQPRRLPMLRSNLARRYLFKRTGVQVSTIQYSCLLHCWYSWRRERHQAPRFNGSLFLLAALLYSSVLLQLVTVQWILLIGLGFLSSRCSLKFLAMPGQKQCCPDGALGSCLSTTNSKAAKATSEQHDMETERTRKERSVTRF